MSVLPRPVVFAFALLVAPPSFAADTWPVHRGPSREPDPVHFDRRMVAAAPKDFLDDAAACVLYAGNTYLVEEDGTTEVIVHDLTRLNGRKSIEKLSYDRNILFVPPYPELTLT